VDTGNTLKANGMEPRDLIMNVSSRLVVNKAALKMKHQAVTEFIRQLSLKVKSP
ncbi:MAG: ATP phosphoribosyltransferase, partial [Candidatus Methylumidiphilus sp.]